MFDKLARLHIPDLVYNWLVEYFQGHSHCTKYENNTSALTDISASIIQGSAISPASYVVHASDLVSITAGNSLCKYADDTYVIPASNHHSPSAELDNIQTWANYNNLNLNCAKCGVCLHYLYSIILTLWVKPKNRPGPAGNIKIVLVITAVDFDQFSLYSTGTSLFSNGHV